MLLSVPQKVLGEDHRKKYWEKITDTKIFRIMAREAAELL